MLTIETTSGKFQFTRYATIRTRKPNSSEGEFSLNKVSVLITEGKDGYGVRIRVGDEIQIKGLGWFPITAISWCASLDREEVARRTALEEAKRAAEEAKRAAEEELKRYFEALSSAEL
jgi:hypothetical protein